LRASKFLSGISTKTPVTVPFNPQTADEHFAVKHTNEAAERVQAIVEALRKEAEANRASNEHFYNSLALFSSGTAALSITYLGYLKTLVKPVQHPRWLIASWISLMICVVFSLFWTFVYGHYTHYARLHEYAEAVKEQNETEVKEIPKLTRNIANLQTSAQLAAFTIPRVQAAEQSEKNAKVLNRRKKFYLWLWRSFGWIAHVSFVVGLALLLGFAIKNT
jgi:hypothetical protein